MLMLMLIYYLKKYACKPEAKLTLYFNINLSDLKKFAGKHETADSVTRIYFSMLIQEFLTRIYDCNGNLRMKKFTGKHQIRLIL